MKVKNTLPEFESSEADILANKKVGRIYVADFKSGKGKYISSVVKDSLADIQLSISPNIEVRITYVVEKKKISGLQISKMNKGREIEKIHLSTLGFTGVLGILKIFSQLDLSSVANKSVVLDAGITKNPDEVKKQLNTIFADQNGLRMLDELATSKGLRFGDITNVSDIRVSLKTFNSLLTEPSYFEETKIKWGKKRDEDVWQQYFEENSWVFGYGLNLVYNQPLQDQKLEAVVGGADVTQSGKRVDGLMKTLGGISSLRLIEIKTHKTKLLKQVKDSYRIGCWQTSDELNGGMIQSQQSVQKTMKNIGSVLRPSDKKTGVPTGEEIFSYLPKSYLIIGSLKEFEEETGINTDKFSSFELMRRNTTSPEVVTFDELYQRACRIVSHRERA